MFSGGIKKGTVGGNRLMVKELGKVFDTLNLSDLNKKSVTLD